MAGTIRKGEIMEKRYFTITGLNYYYGREFLKEGMKVKLIKEPDNEHDSEAIRVEIKSLGKIGYVANSPYTVIGNSRSAGRIYDTFEDKTKGKVVFITSKGVLCELKESKNPV